MSNVQIENAGFLYQTNGKQLKALLTTPLHSPLSLLTDTHSHRPVHTWSKHKWTMSTTGLKGVQCVLERIRIVIRSLKHPLEVVRDTCGHATLVLWWPTHPHVSLTTLKDYLVKCIINRMWETVVHLSKRLLTKDNTSYMQLVIQGLNWLHQLYVIRCDKINWWFACKACWQEYDHTCCTGEVNFGWDSDNNHTSLNCFQGSFERWGH